MKKNVLALLVVLLIGALVSAACSGGAAEEGSGNESGGPEQPAGQEGLDRPEPPAEYASLEYPHPEPGQEVLAEGEEIFTSYCASCHGNEGAGDGPAAAALNPPPADLAVTADQLPPQYLYWRVSEGGAFAPFNSSMPAFKGVLSEDQRWAVVAFVRTLE